MIVVAGKIWSLRRDFEAVHTMRLVPATSRIVCADLYGSCPRFEPSLNANLVPATRF